MRAYGRAPVFRPGDDMPASSDPAPFLPTTQSSIAGPELPDGWQPMHGADSDTNAGLSIVSSKLRMSMSTSATWWANDDFRGVGIVGEGFQCSAWDIEYEFNTFTNWNVSGGGKVQRIFVGSAIGGGETFSSVGGMWTYEANNGAGQTWHVRKGHRKSRDTGNHWADEVYPSSSPDTEPTTLKIRHVHNALTGWRWYWTIDADAEEEAPGIEGDTSTAGLWVPPGYGAATGGHAPAGRSVPIVVLGQNANSTGTASVDLVSITVNSAS